MVQVWMAWKLQGWRDYGHSWLGTVNPERPVMKVQPRLQWRLQDWRCHEEKLQFGTMWQVKVPKRGQEAFGEEAACGDHSILEIPGQWMTNKDSSRSGGQLAQAYETSCMCWWWWSQRSRAVQSPLEPKRLWVPDVRHWATFTYVFGFCFNGYFKKTLDIFKRQFLMCLNI